MDLIAELLPYMRRVQSADRDLKDLGLLWSMIEAGSSISCPVDAASILPTLTETRQRFADLQAQLVRQLGFENLAELGDELGATAQCCIDILVRNLFERTADVGFLATDEVLSDFCAADAATRDALRPAMVARLAAYRDKYTVYDDIIALSPHGDVLARLDESSAPVLTADPVVALAMAGNGYVERYAASALAATSAPALLYAHRIESAGNAKPVGVLVLRFRLADELVRIFSDLVSSRRQTALVLLDAEDRVIQSNDESHVPLGAVLKTAASSTLEMLTFAGREYLAMACPTRGYQGYMGPGWRALAMVSLVVAFRPRHANDDLQDGVALDNEPLRCIQVEVDAINRNLRRVVWNGRLMADARAGARENLKAVLQQVSAAGARMRDRTGLAIRDLYRSSLGRASQQSVEMARLAADIMDRNLYERANDCRWWALSPVLQQVLSQASVPVGPEGTQRLNDVLRAINALYTVYNRLVVFDAQGTICGVSNDDPQGSLVGSAVPQAMLQATKALGDPQRYAVTDFEANALSSGVPTYTYLAAVRETAGGAGRFVGGIAIVFNAEREFRAMLTDVLDGRAGMAAFIDSAGKVLSCSDDSLPIGKPLPFKATDAVMELDGANSAVAVLSTSGYREFKKKDGYSNGVRVVVALRLGALEKRRQALFDTALQPLPVASNLAGLKRTAGREAHAAGAAQELALFQVGSARYAIPVRSVLEARTQNGLVRLAKAGAHVVGLLDAQPGESSCVLPVLCARSLFGVHYPARETDGTVLVMTDINQPGRPLLGFRVDDIISVLDVPGVHIQAAPEGLRQRAPWLAGMARVQQVGGQGEEVIVELLDPAALLALLGMDVAARAGAEGADRLCAA